jgi:regulation of enolase protein 1 (concanavalin A-like superfamily)
MLTMNKAVAISETKDAIEILAPAKTDFFIDGQNGIERNDAPFYYEKRKGDFAIRVRVKPGFKKTYDAGGIFVYDTSKKWIKLEFEMTDLGYPSVVSVVTDGVSDDANGERMDGHDEISLQIVRKGDCWALHYSVDGRQWSMVRYFRLKMKAEVKVGLEAQSPIGSGCAVSFRGLKFPETAVKDLRKGR